MTARKALSKRTRFEVFKRDGFRCTYCGNSPPDVVLVVDHVVPVAGGGSDEISNLTTSCHGCNSGKGAVALGDAVPAFDEMALRSAMQEMAERRLLLSQHLVAAEALRSDQEEVVEWAERYWREMTGIESGYSAFERQSVLTFLRYRLTAEDLRMAMDIVDTESHAESRLASMWKYFCKLCWDTIRSTRQEG